MIPYHVWYPVYLQEIYEKGFSDMEEWQIILLTGGISIVSSIITALITLSRTHRNEVKKLVLEKRSALYFEFYDVAEMLLHNNNKVYDSEYIKVLLQFKPKMKLLSSKDTVEAFKSFFELVTKKYEEYRTFCAENDPRVNPNYFHTYIDEDGVEQEEWHGNALEVSYFESDAEKFKTDNIPCKEEISKHVTALYEQMRNDLGSNIK
jgi:hypothetical protein